MINMDSGIKAAEIEKGPRTYESATEYYIRRSLEGLPEEDIPERLAAEMTKLGFRLLTNFQGFETFVSLERGLRQRGCTLLTSYAVDTNGRIIPTMSSLWGREVNIMPRVTGYINDCRSMERLIAQAEKDYVAEHITQETYDRRTKQIREDFKERCPPEEEYIFNDIKTVSRFLQENFRIQDPGLMKHEEQHAGKARELGLGVMYAVRVLKTETGLGYVAFVRLEGATSLDNVIAIASAPDELSEFDVRQVERCEWMKKNAPDAKITFSFSNSN
jgi:hypothetical protein